MSIRLTIDAMPILIGVGGISNYVSSLIRHFFALSDSHLKTTLHFRIASADRKQRFRIFLQRESGIYSTASIKTTGLPDRILRHLWQSRLPYLGKLTLPETDLYLATTNMMPLYPHIKRVTIIHDLTPAIIPDFFEEPQEEYLRRMRAHIRECDHVIAVSRTTADNIMRFCAVEDNKITVIHPGVPTVMKHDKSDDMTLKELRIRKPFALYVGALAPNKNVDGIIRCFAGFRKKTGLDWQLVLVGKHFMPKGYYEGLATEYDVNEHVLFTGWLGENRWALFRNAEILLHLSWYEGFPLPVMEAMAFGLPVLASNRGPFPEALQNKEQLVDPANECEVIQKIALFAGDLTMQERWKKQMSQRAREFSWQNSARKLSESLKALERN